MARQRSLFLLFVHYKPPEDRHPEEERDPEAERKTFLEEMDYLQQMLQPDSASPSGRGGADWQGIGYVFLDDGLINALRDTPDQSGSDEVSEAQGLVRGRGLNRVRIVGAPRLRGLIGQLREVLPAEVGQNLDAWFAGDTQRLHYDSPKVIEAFIRIANIGRHVPLFRFDRDVLFFGKRALGLTDEERVKERARFRQNILHLCRHYRNLSDDPEISHFVFSGGYLDRDRSGRYETEDLKGPAGDAEEKELLNGFATRLLPLATRPAELRALDEAALKSTRAELRLEPVCNFLRGLYEFGANPFLLVISGAGLCLSDSAILDLPPFSNMRQNVVWIDDHLKYALHHELRHFGYDPGTTQVARLAGAVFPQLREPAGKLLGAEPTLSNVQWHVTNYLPWLLMGCVADAWLRGDKRLKLKVSDLTKQGDDFKKLIDKHVPGVYAREFQDAVLKGVVANEGAFKETLWRLAVKRVCDVASWWQSEPFRGTFLELFATGGEQGTQSESEHEAAVRLRLLPSIAPRGLAEAVNEWLEEVPAPTPDDVPPAVFTKGQKTWRVKPFPQEPRAASGTRLPSERTLALSLVALIDDFVDYIKLASLWRHAVFAVRTLLNRKKRHTNLDWLIPEPFPQGDELLPGSLGVHEQLTSQNAQRFVQALDPVRRDVDPLLSLYVMREIENAPETLTAEQRDSVKGFLVKAGRGAAGFSPDPGSGANTADVLQTVIDRAPVESWQDEIRATRRVLGVDVPGD